MECPVCKTQLTNYRHGELSVDVCGKCGGIWFDKDELSCFIRELSRQKPSAQLKDPSAEQLPAQEESDRNCPVCNKPMEKFRYGSVSDITLDKCPSCRGIWTDADEASAIVEFIKNRRTYRQKNKKFGTSVKEALKSQQNLMNFFESYGRGVFGMKRKGLF